MRAEAFVASRADLVFTNSIVVNNGSRTSITSGWLSGGWVRVGRRSERAATHGTIVLHAVYAPSYASQPAASATHQLDNSSLRASRGILGANAGKSLMRICQESVLYTGMIN